MLSRTAENLFWLSRYVERAEFLARIIEATTRLANMPSAYAGTSNEWLSCVTSAGGAELFAKTHGEATRDAVIDFLAFSPDNPSSIISCFELARTNARAIRTALTGEMWEAINTAWLQLRRYRGTRLTQEELAGFLAFVKETGLRFDGSAYRTMLRNDGYWFSRVGVMMERADNTARILDVKYHVLLPDDSAVGGTLDYFQWSAILRAVSALTAYHWVYKENLKPWLVADLLILNDQMPRSLAACYESLVRNLDALALAYGRQGPAQRTARATRAKLENARIEDVFQEGLHEFITDFIAENMALGHAINDQYLS